MTEQEIPKEPNFSIEELKEMCQTTTRQWLTLQIMLAQKISEQEEATYNSDELTFINNPIEIEGGGTYLLLLTHVSGPKIEMRQKKVAIDPKEKQSDTKSME